MNSYLKKLKLVRKFLNRKIKIYHEEAKLLMEYLPDKTCERETPKQQQWLYWISSSLRRSSTGRKLQSNGEEFAAVGKPLIAWMGWRA